MHAFLKLTITGTNPRPAAKSNPKGLRSFAWPPSLPLDVFDYFMASRYHRLVDRTCSYIVMSGFLTDLALVSHFLDLLSLSPGWLWLSRIEADIPNSSQFFSTGTPVTTTTMYTAPGRGREPYPVGVSLSSYEEPPFKLPLSRIPLVCNLLSSVCGKSCRILLSIAIFEELLIRQSVPAGTMTGCGWLPGRPGAFLAI